MKQYKLKKWYPSLPFDWKEEMLVGKGDFTKKGYAPCSGEFVEQWIPASEVERNGQYWEPVTEIKKEYEILKFHDGSNEYYRKENGKFTINLQYDYEEENLLKQPNYNKITSIKRLSDGEIFSVGDILYDKTNQVHGSFQLQQIEFEIAPADKGTGRLSFIHDHKILGKWIPLKDLVKIKKQPLFTTEDGVDVYYGDEVWAVNVPDKGILCTSPMQAQFVSSSQLSSASKLLWFSSEKSAEKWITMNRRVITLSELYDLKGFSNPDGNWVNLNLVEQVIERKIKNRE